MKKRTWKNSWKNIFLYSSAVFSILGTFYTFLNDKLTLIIALVAVCLALTIIICIITRFFITWVEPQSGDRKTEKRSSFIKYEASNDAKKIVYEIYRLIQIKCSILSEYTYDFLWSGKNQPKISSKLQNFVRIQKSRNEYEMDSAIFKFKKPVHYNQNALIHVKADLDDADLSSGTYVESTITEDIDIIHYRIVLKYKNNDEKAILEKRRIGAISVEYRKIDEISFDNETKSYEYHLLNPDVGFIYRIRWNR